jgi:hypothetical protein
LAEIDGYLSRDGNQLIPEKLIPGYATPSALALLDRDLWAACEGYDERLVNWGWMEIDLYLRLCQQVPWRDLASQGVTLFHLEHYPNNDRNKTPRRKNPTAVPRRFEAGNPDWGHPELNLPSIAARSGAPKARGAGWMLPENRQEMIAAALSPDTKDALVKCAKHFSPGLPASGGAGNDAKLLAVVASLARTLQPRVYLQIASGRPEVAAIVATLMPACCLFLANTEATQHEDMLPWLRVLQSASHKAHCQFIGGDRADLFDRFSAVLGAQRPTLVFLELPRGIGLEKAAKEVCRSVRLLRSGGAVVLHTAADLPAGFANAALEERRQARVLDVGNGIAIVGIPSDEDQLAPASSDRTAAA